MEVASWCLLMRHCVTIKTHVCVCVCGQVDMRACVTVSDSDFLIGKPAMPQ